MVPSDAKISAVGCSSVQFGERGCFRKLHSTAHLCMALKPRGRFDSLHPLQSSGSIAYNIFRWRKSRNKNKSKNISFPFTHPQLSKIVRSIRLLLHHVRSRLRPLRFAGLQVIDQGVEEHQPDATLLTSLPELTLRTGGLPPFSLHGNTSRFSLPRDNPVQGHCAPPFSTTLLMSMAARTCWVFTERQQKCSWVTRRELFSILMPGT